MQGMLSCSSSTSALKDIDMQYLKTQNVEDMGYMFSGLRSLNSITFPATFNTGNVINMEYMFGYCTSITALDLSNFRTTMLQKTTSMFTGMEKVKTIYVHETWDLSNVTKSDGMFQYCNVLKGGAGSSVDGSILNKNCAIIDKTDGYKTGYLSTKHVTLKVGTDVKSKISNATKVEFVTLGADDMTGYSDIATSVHYYSKGLIRIYKKGSTEYRIASYYPIYANSNCSNMFSSLSVTSFVFNNFNTSEVTSMYRMFAECNDVRYLDFPSDFTTENVTDFAYMFSGCDNLRYVDALYFEFKQENYIIFEGMFSGCPFLYQIHVSACTNWVPYIDNGLNMFNNTTNLCVEVQGLDFSYYTIPIQPAGISFSYTQAYVGGDWIGAEYNSSTGSYVDCGYWTGGVFQLR